MDTLRDPLAIAFNLTEQEKNDMTFKDLYYDCDVLICEQFEGDPPRYNFTEEQWEYVTDAALYALTMRFTDYAR